MQETVQNFPQRITMSEMYDRVVDFITFESFLMFAVIYGFIIWIIMILRVTMDIGNRSSNIFLQFMSILLVTVLWPLWLLMYLVIRPKSHVNKKYLKEIEHNLTVLAHIVEKERNWLIFCPKCSKSVSHNAKICSKCKENLEKKCDECSHIVRHNWKNCLYCSSKLKKERKKKKK